jgi:intracellular septation protein A
MDVSAGVMMKVLEAAMRDLLNAGKLLLFDLASTVVFLLTLLGTRNLPVSVASGMMVGTAQVGWLFAYSKPIDVMQWMSLVAVLGSGAATLISNDPRFLMVKPSVLYVAAGLIMLKPGWMNRYLPSSTQETLSDVARAFGFAWAGLMFISAAVNLFVALTFSVLVWSAAMPVYGILSKAGFAIFQHAIMRYTARLRASSLQCVAAA